MAFANALDIKYITDTTGKRREVIVPYQVWKKLNDELDALKEKHEILLGLRKACKEVKLQQKGELEEQTLDEFLNEL